MEKTSLAALLDEEREMVLDSIARDRTPAAAQTAMEKALDRVMYRYVERCDDAGLRDSAQQILQTMKNLLPMMDAVGEARTWNAQYTPGGGRGLRMKPKALAALIAGLVLILATVIGALMVSRNGGLLAFIKVALPVALGCGCLFFSGVLSARGDQAQGERREAPRTRTEFLVDADKVWHCLRGAMLQADGQLDRVREQSQVRRARAAEDAPSTRIDPEALSLFADLLELAYASQDECARESVAAIRFYLHNAKIDVSDYAAGKENWFEFLPADNAGTIRPALTSEGRVVRKGLAAARQ